MGREYRNTIPPPIRTKAAAKAVAAPAPAPPVAAAVVGALIVAFVVFSCVAIYNLEITTTTIRITKLKLPTPPLNISLTIYDSRGRLRKY